MYVLLHMFYSSKRLAAVPTPGSAIQNPEGAVLPRRGCRAPPQ